MQSVHVAQSKFNFTQIRDAVISKEDGKLVAYGNVRSFTDPADSGYNILTLSTYRLDHDMEEFKDNDKLRFRVPTGFCLSKDSTGKVRLPVYQITPVKKDALDNSFYEFQLFY
jgi:hypothetical protein